MKILHYILIILLFCSTTVSADELVVPFECYPDEVIEVFRESGFKLEPGPEHRDADSWGFLKNEGTQYRIFTYKSLTKDELEKILKIFRRG